MTRSAPNTDQTALLHLRRMGGLPCRFAPSPLLGALGCEVLRFDTNPDAVVLRYTPETIFRQGSGVIQGGAVSAMLDFAMAFAAMLDLDDTATVTTTMMSTSYAGAARGDVFTATGTVRRSGRRMIFADADLFADDQLVATASSTLLVLNGA